jgi:hypothetical protein
LNSKQINHKKCKEKEREKKDLCNDILCKGSNYHIPSTGSPYKYRIISDIRSVCLRIVTESGGGGMGVTFTVRKFNKLLLLLFE